MGPTVPDLFPRLYHPLVHNAWYLGPMTATLTLRPRGPLTRSDLHALLE